jgi:hypothetical protein
MAGETRSMLVALKVTPAEKRRIEFVAGARGCNVSDLLRDLSVREIMAEGERIARALRGAA